MKFWLLHHQLWTHWAYSHVNLFCATGFFLYPLKTLENQRFTDVFGRCRKRAMTRWKNMPFFNPLTTILIRNRNMVTFCWGSEMPEPSLIHFEDLFSLKFNAQNSIQSFKKSYQNLIYLIYTSLNLKMVTHPSCKFNV